MNWHPTWRELLGRSLPGIPWGNRALLKGFLLVLSPLVHVENMERLRDIEDPVLYVFNHNTFFETLFAALMLAFHRGRVVSFFVDWMYGQFPLIGNLIDLIDPVYVYTKRSQFAWVNRRKPTDPPSARAAGAARLTEGRSLALFPEGKAHQDPRRLRPARRGLAWLILATGVPVVPIGIDFPARIRSMQTPRFGRIVFRVGEPCVFEEERKILLEQGACGNARELRLALEARVTRKVMEQLADLANKDMPCTEEAWRTTIRTEDRARVA